MKDKIETVRGSGNVFHDLGMANADVEHMKAKLAAWIIGIMDDRKLTAVKAAKLTDIAESEISRIRNVDLNRFTIDRLVRILNKLGQQADVVVRQQPAGRNPAHP